MGRDTLKKLKLVIVYDTLATRTQIVKDKKEAEWIVHNEGDHVWDWYVKENE